MHGIRQHTHICACSQNHALRNVMFDYCPSRKSNATLATPKTNGRAGGSQMNIKASLVVFADHERTCSDWGRRSRLVTPRLSPSSLHHPTNVLSSLARKRAYVSSPGRRPRIRGQNSLKVLINMRRKSPHAQSNLQWASGSLHAWSNRQCTTELTFWHFACEV